MASFSSEPFSRGHCKLCLPVPFLPSARRPDNRRKEGREKRSRVDLPERRGCNRTAWLLFRSTSSTRDSAVLFSPTRRPGTSSNRNTLLFPTNKVTAFVVPCFVFFVLMIWTLTQPRRAQTFECDLGVRSRVAFREEVCGPQLCQAANTALWSPPSLEETALPGRMEAAGPEI